MKNPVIYQKMIYDKRAITPGLWIMFSIYKHSSFWQKQKDYYKTPFCFLSFSKWHFEIGICVGKISLTLNYHHPESAYKWQ